MVQNRKITKEYWKPEGNFMIRYFYRTLPMNLAFGVTLIYIVPWLVILYYLFRKNGYTFIIAMIIYLIVFTLHVFSARYISRQVKYRLMLQEMDIERVAK
jgi:hypothetical protein